MTIANVGSTRSKIVRTRSGRATHGASLGQPRRRQQVFVQFLSRQQELRRRTIRTAYLAVAGALPSGRPNSHRTSFDNAARTSNPYTPGVEMGKPLKAVVHEAVLLGDPHVIEQVRDRVHEFYRACATEVLAELPCATDDICHIEALLAEARANCRADIPQAEALVRPNCRAALERFVEWGEIHYDRLGIALTKVRRLLAVTAPPKLRTASRG